MVKYFVFNTDILATSTDTITDTYISLHREQTFLEQLHILGNENFFKSRAMKTNVTMNVLI